MTPLAGLLISLADDEWVIGFSDSEWTGIAPFLEEDVAMSSLAQDELGHAQAYYRLAADLLGTDPDALAYDRRPEEYRHCRLLDHPRGDWALAMARRYLYDTADATRLAALAASSYEPLAEIVAKIRREETYHLMHVEAWLGRLAETEGEPRERLIAALGVLAPDATTVFTPLAGEDELVGDGVIAAPMSELRGRWLRDLALTFARYDLPMPPSATDPRGREDHGEAFRWLWNEFTAVRRLEPEAVW